MNDTNVTGPKRGFLTGHLAPFGDDPLRFLERCVREHGDFVPLRFFHRQVCLLNDPAAIEQVLAGNSRNFRKTLGYRTPFMRRLFGEGLLTSEGEFWMRQRRLAQPAFHRERITGYARIIVEFVQELLGTWQTGQVRDIHRDMLRLTTQVVTKTLFNAEVSREIENLGEASEAVMKHFTTQWSIWRFVASLLPTRDKRRFRQVMRQVDDFIYRLIEERRISGVDAGDLLSLLLLARDEDGSGMTDKQLRDELTTLMVAGLDTTALALSWAFYLLSRDPKQAGQLFEAIQSVANGRPVGVADLPNLGCAEIVVKEAMRLYPPAWIVGREAIADCVIGGRRIRKGTSLIMSQWLMHRDPRYFEHPNEFVPERWTEKRSGELPKYAYFPFGGGPRSCIGNSFAMMEATLVLALVIQRFRIVAVSDTPVLPWASITLQPRGGISIRVEARM